MLMKRRTRNKDYNDDDKDEVWMIEDLVLIADGSTGIKSERNIQGNAWVKYKDFHACERQGYPSHDYFQIGGNSSLIRKMPM